jgi:hypothetical protein
MRMRGCQRRFDSDSPVSAEAAVGQQVGEGKERKLKNRRNRGKGGGWKKMKESRNRFFETTTFRTLLHYSFF